jgi:hypothetical protein
MHPFASEAFVIVAVWISKLRASIAVSVNLAGGADIGALVAITATTHAVASNSTP